MSDRDLNERIKRLERDNRHLRVFALLGLLVATALTSIYATRPVPDVIKAHEFDVADNAGKTKIRMGLREGTDWPEITLLDSMGRPRAQISVLSGMPLVALYSTEGKPGAAMTIFSDGSPTLTLSELQKRASVDMSLDASGSPLVRMHDTQGFEMDLGGTETLSRLSGKRTGTTADSIVMFGNGRNHRVIWQAP
jgi:hypothetical protein